MVIGSSETQGIWISADYHPKDSEGFIVVNDGLSNGLNEDGVYPVDSGHCD